jgi:hypothetical protein
MIGKTGGYKHKKRKGKNNVRNLWVFWKNTEGEGKKSLPFSMSVGA